MRIRELNETDVDIWPAFTDFLTSVLFIVVLFIFGILFSSVAQSRNEIEVVRQQQRHVRGQLEARLGKKLEIPAEDGNLQRIILLVDEQGGGGVLFDRGRATLSPDGKKLLDSIAEVLEANRDEYDTIQVEGHTDDVPVHSAAYSSNWELSAARAGAVVNYLLEERVHSAGQQRLEPWRLSANGRADFRPYGVEENRMSLSSQANARKGPGLQYVVAANENEEKARRNRRIEIILTYKVTSQSGQR